MLRFFRSQWQPQGQSMGLMSIAELFMDIESSEDSVTYQHILVMCMTANHHKLTITHSWSEFSNTLKPTNVDQEPSEVDVFCLI